MGLRKSIGHLRRDISGYGPLKGTRVLWLKTLRGGRPRKLASDRLGGVVWVRPGTTDMPIFDQIALDPYMPLDMSDPPTVIVDLGANIGLSTRFFKSAYPGARIVAVEPDPQNFAMLTRNTEGIADVHCEMAGIWPEDGWIRLKQDGLGSSGFRTEDANDGHGSTLALSMTTLMARARIDRISLLKIDIEGAEKDLFSAKDLSWMDRVDRIAIELHDHIRPGAGQVFFEALRRDAWNIEVFHGVLMCRRLRQQR